MVPDSPLTLLTRARRSFAEIRAAFPFPDSPETVIVIDQDPPGEYRIRARFDGDPARPALWVERFPKPNLPPPLTGEEPEYPARVRQGFDAFSDGSQFGWLKRPVSEAPLSSADIIGIVRGLL
jgi:hypothetical protein